MVYRQTNRTFTRMADRRARILKSARVIVAEEGWAAATISNVAGRSGIATGTVYRYWASKADLCVELVATVSAREIEVLRKIAATDAPAEVRLRSAVATFLRRALRGRRLAYAMIAEPCDPEVEEVRLKYRADLALCIAGILQDGIASDEFDSADCDVTATCITGAFMEALVGPLVPLRQRGREEDRALIDKVSTFCMRAASARGSSGVNP